MVSFILKTWLIRIEYSKVNDKLRIMSDWSLLMLVMQIDTGITLFVCFLPMIAGRNISSQSSLWIWESIID